MKNDSIIETKTFDFAMEIVKLYKNTVNSNNHTLLNQLLRSGTSIGANVAEGERGQTKADFLSKMNIALKEANETKYWLRLLHETKYLGNECYGLIDRVDEIMSILVAITKNKS